LGVSPDGISKEGGESQYPASWWSTTRSVDWSGSLDWGDVDDDVKDVY